MFDAEYITKDFKKVWGKKTPEQLAGQVRHDAFENSLILGAPLPPEFDNEDYMQATHARLLAIKKRIKGTLQTESMLGISHDFCERDYKGKDTWFRGKIDVDILSRDGKICYIGDFKNGKSQWTTADQLDRMAVLAFSRDFGVDKVIAEYHYLQEKHSKKFIYYKHKDLQKNGEVSKTETQVKDKLKYDIKLIETCHEQGNWVTKRNGLCKKHCAVLDCQYNGK